MTRRAAASVPTAPDKPLTPAARRRVAAREAILKAARELVAESGFPGAQMSLIAVRAGVGVGSIYQHFPSRSELFAEVYRATVTREFDVVERAVAAATGGSVEKIRIAVETFCTRALRAGRFAYSLLVEPVDASLDEHRLAFREGYRELFARLLTEGIANGDLPPQDPDLTAAAVLGIMTETLVRPLGDARGPKNRDALVQSVVALCESVVSAGQ